MMEGKLSQDLDLNPTIQRLRQEGHCTSLLDSSDAPKANAQAPADPSAQKVYVGSVEASY